MDLELHAAHDHMDLIQNAANSWMEDNFQDNDKLRCEFDKLFYHSKSQASWSRNNGQASPAVRR